MKFRVIYATAVVACMLSDVADCGALKKQFANKEGQQENINIGEDEKDASRLESNEATTISGHSSEADAPAASSSSEVAAMSTGPTEKKKIEGDPVVLRISGKKEYRRSHILEDMKKIPPQMVQGVPPDRLFEMIRDQKLNVYLMTEQAKKAGMDRTKEFQDQLEQTKEDLLGRLFLMRELGPKVENESAIKSRYTKYLVEFKKGKEFQVFHILVSTEEEAKGVLAALGKNEDFGKLAREKSTAPSKDKNGEEGYLPVDMMPPQIKDKLILLKSGEYTKEYTKTEHGYHIFKVGDIRETSPAKYEEAVPMMKQLIMREEMMKLMERLEKQVKVERFNEDGTPAAKPKANAAL